MRIIEPLNWVIILWSSIERGLLAGVIGPKPMIPTIEKIILYVELFFKLYFYKIYFKFFYYFSKSSFQAGPFKSNQ